MLVVFRFVAASKVRRWRTVESRKILMDASWGASFRWEGQGAVGDISWTLLGLVILLARGPSKTVRSITVDGTQGIR
jgi:hypothetical protein